MDFFNRPTFIVKNFSKPYFLTIIWYIRLNFHIFGIIIKLYQLFSKLFYNFTFKSLSSTVVHRILDQTHERPASFSSHQKSKEKLFLYDHSRREAAYSLRFNLQKPGEILPRKVDRQADCIKQGFV